MVLELDVSVFQCDTTAFQPIGWAGDCISVEYGQEKMKKGGGRNNMNSMLKHLFANPFEPAVLHPYSTLTPPLRLLYSTLTPLHPYVTARYSTLTPLRFVHLLRLDCS